MNRAVKIISIIVGIVLIGFVGRCIYMVLCISCTTPSIKTYDYNGSMDQFENNLKNFTNSNLNLTYKVSRRGPGAYDARDIIALNKTQSGLMRYELVVYKFNETTKLDIDCIYDETRNVGGCNTEDKIGKELFERFKSDFLLRFEKGQHITLEPNFFNF
ncbi:MAG: hypothetical protein JWP37_3365 [Mucilaginibacter sp.]|nr:hypothetical protein [Mucilaginibacter sp.]